MKKSLFFLFTTVLGATLTTSVFAHFGMVIPSTNIVTQEQKFIDIALSFSHPYEGIGMDLEKPKQFFLFKDGKKTDLTASLVTTLVMDRKSWKSRQKLQRPGVYQYVMEPFPYWEPAEDIFIIHYSKTLVAAFGSDENWSEPVGLATEIVPQLRPFGNYAGNSFGGQVLLDGEPVPFIEVEVEYYNDTGRYTPPSTYHITQIIRADKNGIFNFTCPLAGWWGFSALSEAEFTLPGPDKTPKNVEIAGVIWVFFDALSE